MAPRLPTTPYAGVGAGLRAPHGPVFARERGYKGQVISLEIIGLRQAERIPPGLKRAYQAMMRTLEIRLVESFKAVVPGSPDGRLGRQVHAKRLANSRIVVGTFGSQFAKALDRGFTSKGTKKGGRVLRFDVDGQTLYRPVVHVAGRHYFVKAVAAADPIIEATYMEFFFDPRDLRFG